MLFLSLLFLTAVFLGTCVVLAILNPVLNKGPLLIAQTRVGQFHKPFRMYKFRTMRGAVVNGRFESQDVQRITTLGRILRATHLDEVPQVINIWRGQMVLIGPRPEQPCVFAQLSKEIPCYHMRALVKPGLTGTAQFKNLTKG